MALSSLPFIDMVLGMTFCEAKIPGPVHTELIDLDQDQPDAVAQLRQACREASSTADEFVLSAHGMRLRVTTMDQLDEPVWFLSRLDASVRPLAQLPVPRDVAAFCLRPRLQGLILVTGGFGTGKTTTASSLFCHRIAELGGTGIALEDPTGEVQMAGRHGQGRILQVPVSAHTGGFHSALLRVRRSRADMVMIGEIRDAATAVQVQDIANVDMPVIATLHATTVEDALDKYQAYLRSQHASSAEANARLALSVSAVLHLTREYVNDAQGRACPRFIPRCLVIDRDDPAHRSITSKIRDGNFTGLADDIAVQAARRTYQR